MKEGNNYHLPEPRLDWNRNVEAEELYNLSISIPLARRALETGVNMMIEDRPFVLTYDDLDRDSIWAEPATWKDIEVIDNGLLYGENILAKHGVIFEKGYDTNL